MSVDSFSAFILVMFILKRIKTKTSFIMVHDYLCRG
jgi:hypothetical protein